MPIPFSDEVDVHPEVGPRPATWFDGGPITNTVWDNVRVHYNHVITGRMGLPPTNKSDTIWGILSADDGQASAGKALIPDNAGLIANLQGIGINTTAPTHRLHIVNGSIETTGGTINVGKNEDQTAHIGRGRISHFNITNPQTGATSSSVSFSHHDCALATDFALLQTEDGETLLNSDTGKHMEFRLGGAEKMRLHTNGYLGINQQSPTTELDVGGSIKASGNIIATGTLEAHANSNDASAVSQIGNAKIGANTWDNYVSFSHKNLHTSSGYGLRL